MVNTLEEPEYAIGEPITCLQIQKYSRIGIKDVMREYMKIIPDSWIVVRKGTCGTVIFEKYEGELDEEKT